MDIKCISSMAEVSPAQWNALLIDNHPMLSHAFLYGMEQYECLTEQSGWQPRYLIIESEDNLIAAMPLYEKTNSWGEFVFDHAWADAYAHYGLSYYPKLVAAIPFSPVFGQKLLVQAGREEELYPLLLEGALSVTESLSNSSFHVLFPLQTELAFFESEGFIARYDCQYHWFNKDYDSFDAFLLRLSRRKRKNIRQERKRVVQADIQFRVLDGMTATSEDWENFTLFYNLTYERKWGAPIFNQAFFEATARALGKQMVLILADRDDRCIAGALMYRSDEVLYGRHWGCREYHHALHFETCYYQGIDYCIKHKLKVFEPGAQGPHKIARGFDPVLTRSAHYLRDKRFVPAIKRFCEHEKNSVVGYVEEARLHGAYKDT